MGLPTCWKNLPSRAVVMMRSITGSAETFSVGVRRATEYLHVVSTVDVAPFQSLRTLGQHVLRAGNNEERLGVVVAVKRHRHTRRDHAPHNAEVIMPVGWRVRNIYQGLVEGRGLAGNDDGPGLAGVVGEPGGGTGGRVGAELEGRPALGPLRAASAAGGSGWFSRRSPLHPAECA
jgi:hypothetical protein